MLLPLKSNQPLRAGRSEQDSTPIRYRRVACRRTGANFILGQNSAGVPTAEALRALPGTFYGANAFALKPKTDGCRWSTDGPCFEKRLSMF